LRRLVYTVKLGAFVGACVAVLAGALIALQGTEVLTAEGITVVELMAMYVGGGVVGGAIVGCLLPVAKRSAVLSMLVGYAAIFPFMLVLGMAFTRQFSEALIIAPIMSLSGAYAAWLVWRDMRSPQG
jgi:hypothetical protein